MPVAVRYPGCLRATVAERTAHNRRGRHLDRGVWHWFRRGLLNNVMQCPSYVDFEAEVGGIDTSS